MRKKWKDPSVTDALLFAMTELGEATDQFLRFKTQVKSGEYAKEYTRNNNRCATPKKFATELFDCIMMCIIALDLLGFDLDEIAQAKLQKMDEKRKVAE